MPLTRCLLCVVVCCVVPVLRPVPESNRLGVLWRLLEASALVSQERRDQLVELLKQSLRARDGDQLLLALVSLDGSQSQSVVTAEAEVAADETGDDEPPAATAVITLTATTSSAALDAEQSTAYHPPSSSLTSLSSESPPSRWLSSRRVSYFGSLLLQSLLSAPLSDTSLSAALVAMPAADLARLACDGSGGPVLECLLRVHSASSFSHPLSTQQRLMDVLLPRVSELALSASGSYVVERMYSAADARRKRAIAQALAKDEKRLRHSKPAAILLKRCRLQHSQHSKQVRAHTQTRSLVPQQPCPLAGCRCRREWQYSAVPLTLSTHRLIIAPPLRAALCVSQEWTAAVGARKRKAELFSDILTG